MQGSAQKYIIGAAYIVNFVVFAADMAEQRRPIDVFIIGHSYVRRLREFEETLEKGSRDRRNLGLSDHRFRVHYLGMGGADLRSGRRGATHQRFVEFVPAPVHNRPSIVFIHMGENDLRHGESPDGVVRRIRDLVSDVTGPDRVVYVSQLLPFPAMPHHRQDTWDVNTALRRMWSGSVGGPVRFWSHRGLWSPAQGVFDAQGVHLNPHGYNRYWHSVRTAVMKGLHELDC